MSSAIYTYEGEADKEGKTLTLWMEGPDPMTGKPMKQKHVIEIKDQDARTMTFYNVGEDGKDQVMGTIEYKRRK
jgi:hypothetical protein